MKEKLKDWKFLAIITAIALGLFCLSIYLYHNTARFPWRWITVMSILFWISFLWFVRIRVKEDWIRRILSLFVCSSALAITFFLLMKEYNIDDGWYVYVEWSSFKKLFITMLAVSGVCIVTFLLLLIWKKPEQKSNKK